jgi:phage shock protein PspC (stress-responsive transcriptional regulator)
MRAGISDGLAAYLHIDPTIVRIIFVVLAVVTNGAFVFDYLVLAIVIPLGEYAGAARGGVRGSPSTRRS